MVAAAIVASIASVGNSVSANEPVLSNGLWGSPVTRQEFVERMNGEFWWRQLDGTVIFEGRTYEAGEFFDKYAATGVTFTIDRDLFVTRPYTGAHSFDIIVCPLSEVQLPQQPLTAAQQQPPGRSSAISIFLDGQLIVLDRQPVQESGRTLVPLRGVFESMGAEVRWDGATQTVTASKGSSTAVLTIGSQIALVNGSEVSIGQSAVTAKIIDGRTMVPLRFISEALGLHVHSEVGGRVIRLSTLEQVQAHTPASNDRNDADYWRAHVASTQSRAELPNRRLTDVERSAWIAEYNALGGANAYELEVIRLVNEIRVEHGLNALTIEQNLMYGTRFYAQTVVEHRGSGHNVGPYGGSAFAIFAFAGFHGARNSGGGLSTPQNTVDRWMNSDGHRAVILSTGQSLIGAGAYSDGTRSHAYLVLSSGRGS